MRTGNNVFADDLTRLSLGEARQLLEREGFDVDLLPAWKDRVSNHWIRRVLSWEGDDPDLGRVAHQLREKRSGLRIPRPLGPAQFAGGVVLTEWRASLGTYARAAQRAGATAWATRANVVPEGWDGLADLLWQEEPGHAKRCDVLATSLTLDRQGVEMTYLIREVGAWRPDSVLVD